MFLRQAVIHQNLFYSILFYSKLIDQNTELQYTRKYFAEAPKEVNQKLQQVKQQFKEILQETNRAQTEASRPVLNNLNQIELLDKRQTQDTCHTQKVENILQQFSISIKGECADEWMFSGVGELNDTIEQNHMQTLKQIMLVPELSEDEKDAINAIGHEYEKHKKVVDVLMDEKLERDKIQIELDRENQQLHDEIEKMRLIALDSKKIAESMTAENKELQNEIQILKDKVNSLQVELMQSELFVKSGLVEQYREVRQELLKSEVSYMSRVERSSGTARYDSECNNILRSSELYKMVQSNTGFELQDESLLHNEVQPRVTGSQQDLFEQIGAEGREEKSIITQRMVNSMVSHEFEQEEKLSISELSNKFQDKLQETQYRRKKNRDKVKGHHKLKSIQETEEPNTMLSGNFNDLLWKQPNKQQEAQQESQNGETQQQINHQEQEAGAFEDLTASMEKNLIDVIPGKKSQIIERDTEESSLMLLSREGTKKSQIIKPTQTMVTTSDFIASSSEAPSSKTGTFTSVNKQRPFDNRMTLGNDIPLYKQQTRESGFETFDPTLESETHSQLKPLISQNSYFDQHLPFNPSVTTADCKGPAIFDAKGQRMAREKSNPFAIRTDRSTLNKPIPDNPQRSSKIADLLSRATNLSRQRQSLIQRASNLTDFDYLALRSVSNLRFFKQIDKVLASNDQQDEFSVFSEVMTKYDSRLNSTELIVLVTSQSIYLLNNRCQLQSKHALVDLKQIILITTDPCFLTLTFEQSQPLILKTYRRAELVIFTLTQTEALNQKPKILRGKYLRFHQKNGSSELVKFDEDQRLRPQWLALDLGIFSGSLMCGYLNKMHMTLFKKLKWDKCLMVLTEVGLLQFDDSGEVVKDFVPLVGCEVSSVSPDEADCITTAFRITYHKQEVVFCSESFSEYDSWLRQIRQVQAIRGRDQANYV